MSTATLLDLLEKHYIKRADRPGGVFLREVGENGNWGSGQRADALYVGFTSASGRLLIGHEVKVSRSDWLTELKKVGKADRWADECHAWYLVVEDPAIVHEHELPEGWGLMAPGPRGMKIITRARIYDRRPSWDAVRSIMARWDTLNSQAAHQIKEAARQAGEDHIRAEVERRVRAGMSYSDREKLERLHQFEEALGFRLDRFSWQDGVVGLDELRLAIRLVKAGDLEQVAASMARLSQTVMGAAKHLVNTATDVGQFLETLGPMEEGEDTDA